MPLFRTKRLLIFIIIVFTHNLDTAIFAQGWTTQRRRRALIEQGPSFPSHQATGGWSQTQSFNITTKIIQDNCIENSAFIVLHVAFKILQYPHPGKITNNFFSLSSTPSSRSSSHPPSMPEIAGRPWFSRPGQTQHFSLARSVSLFCFDVFFRSAVVYHLMFGHQCFQCLINILARPPKCPMQCLINI